MTCASEAVLQLHCPAAPDMAARLRHALSSFLTVLAITPDKLDDILTATGEALANAMEHAYDGRERGEVMLRATYDPAEKLTIAVADDGNFIERELRIGRGFGLRIIRSIACQVDVRTTQGTTIHMVFDI